MMDRITIAIGKDTHAALISLGNKGESFDDVIKKLLSHKKKREE